MTKEALWSNDGWLRSARRIDSPNCDERPANETPYLLVIHAISLPPNVFSGEAIAQLFTNCLDPNAHPYFASIAHLRVSAHFLIRRDGELIQFVSTDQRAWHAGVSSWQGRERCNDFSLGVELEGSDYEAFSAAQYTALKALIAHVKDKYPLRDIAGHSDIAPDRKTDPGPYFDWTQL